MAIRKKRSSGHPSSSSTPIVTYTITVAHEPDAECDACAQPRSTLIEQENGAWVCELCLGEGSHSDFWRSAVITTMPWGGDW